MRTDQYDLLTSKQFRDLKTGEAGGIIRKNKRYEYSKKNKKYQSFQQENHIFGGEFDIAPTLTSQGAYSRIKIMEDNMNKFIWPKPHSHKMVLKDILEDSVNEKYYLSNERIKAISKWNAQQKPFENMEKADKNGYFATLTTRDGDEQSGMKLVKVNVDNISKSGHHGGKVNDTKSVAPTFKENHGNALFIKENNLKIRKITPKESLRLMGLNDERIKLIQDSNLISHNKQYFIAGNSIVVQVLQSIFNNIDFPKGRALKVFETFSGYGSQAIALENLGYELESHISEWFADAIIAYALLHHNKEFYKQVKRFNDIQEKTNKSKEYYLGVLSKWTISLDSKKPSNLKNKSIDYIINIISACIVSNNQGSILDIDPNQLDKYDLLTYSFPCQDLSLAGKSKGMKKGDKTRSGLLWEIERILLGLKELDKLPMVLLMENVPQIHGKLHIKDFEKWQLALNKIGYKNTWKDLNAKDYGIPQNRNRTFMVSILDGEVDKESTINMSIEDFI